MAQQTTINLNDQSKFNEYSNSLFKSIAKLNENQNLIISPISIHLALSMLTEGAKNEVYNELLSLLKTTPEQIGNIQRSLNNMMLIENSCWVKSQVDPNYVTTLHNKFGAEAHQLTSKEPIIQWIKEHSKGMIKNLEQFDVDQLDILVLVNVVIFKANWKFQFKTSETSKMNFGTNRKVDMMHQKFAEKVNYFENEFAQLVDLPYYGSSAVATIVLPSTSFGSLDEFVSKSFSDIPNWTKQMKPMKGNLHVPKIQLEHEVSNMIQTLKSLGCNKMFEFSQDLSKISQVDDLKVSRICHKVFFQFDESGTKAAAATTVSVALRCIEETFDMNVNRPYLIIVRLGDVHLFIAKIHNP